MTTADAARTRAFIAVALGADARAALARDIARFAAAVPSARWVHPASLHLTLAFLGDLDDARLAAAQEAAQITALQVAPFNLSLASFGSFGPAAAPTVIWAGVGGASEQLRLLQSRLADALAADGFPREARSYAPHFTLARVKTRLAPPELATLQRLLAESHTAQAPWTVRELHVMESVLARPAARYRRLATYPLAGLACVRMTKPYQRSQG